MGVEKYSNIKFHENPPIGSRAVPSRRTDRQTDVTKLIVAFHNSANAPKNSPTYLLQNILCEIQNELSLAAKTQRCASYDLTRFLLQYIKDGEQMRGKWSGLVNTA